MPVKLTQSDIEDLKRQGFSEQEIAKAVGELETEERQDISQQPQRPNPQNNVAQSSFNSKVSDDVARVQLELDDILAKAEHTLRGDIVKFENGNVIWTPNPKPLENTLNDFGVQLIMKILSMYINRNTILSDYTEEEVRYKTLDIGKEMNNLIFMKYEEMGIDDGQKRKEYPIIIRQMTDIIHSAYARAKDGRERESYRKMISVQQSNQNGMGMMAGIPQQQKTRGILNPMRYLGSSKV